MWQEEAEERDDIAGFEDGEKAPRAKNASPLEVGKSKKKMESPLESPERNAALPTLSF